MKKVLCIFLSVVMILPLGIFASASGEEPVSERPYTEIEKIETENPVIVVRGMNFTGGLQYDRGTENAKPVQPEFDAGELFTYLTKTVAAVLSTFSIEAGVSVICEYVVKLFSGYPCDNNGDSLHENITPAYYPLSVAHYPELLDKNSVDETSIVTSLAYRYGSDMVYYFVYDWRLDPMDNADLLDEMVNEALTSTGKEKVDIICCSMGGSIAMAYMAEYGYDRIDTLVSNTSVMFGADVVSDLFQGKVLFDAGAVERYLTEMVPSIAGLVKVLSFTGILDGLCDFLNKFASKYETQIFEESLIPTFATLPGFWSMVHGEDYPVCREYIFSGIEDEYAGLLIRLDAFYNSVSSRRQEITDGALDAGVKLAVIANYDTPLVPAYERAVYHGDGMVETSAMSGGALVSVLGDILPEDELCVGDSKYVSPDKCINASTCIYPEYTWFMKGAGHVVGLYGSDGIHFVLALLESEVQPDINTWSEYPQFMLSDEYESIKEF